MSTFTLDTISDEAIAAITEIRAVYLNGIRYSILFAQMQSGKTCAFLLLAGEMLRTNQVEHVVIFTGNRECELKNQLIRQVLGTSTERSFFETKYFKHLASTCLDGLTTLDEFSQLNDKIYELKNRIHIVWGTDLTKQKDIPTENTLYIFEESHFAQSVGQTPSKFMNIIGIPANGDMEMLEEKNNYICSVSATPFSEMCDNGNLVQTKKVVCMKPGQKYRGVQWLKDNGRIVGYDRWDDALVDALRLYKRDFNWAIVRVRGPSQMAEIELICLDEGWAVRKYDQDVSDIESMQELETKPDFPTVVLLKERCRMGTVVPKPYLSFLFETSGSSKTDTLLQGLLGRACGYHTNDHIEVYIHNSLLESGEIESYLDLCSGKMIVPNNAKNVISGKRMYRPITLKTVDADTQTQIKTKLYPAIPIHIPSRCISEHASFKERAAVAIDIRNNLELDEEVIRANKNPKSVQIRIVQKLDKMIQEKQAMKINASRLVGSGKGSGSGEGLNKTFRLVPAKLLNLIERGEPLFGLGSGCGTVGLRLYYVDKPIENMEVGSYYLCCYVEMSDDEVSELKTKRVCTENPLPSTTGSEIFRYKDFQTMTESGETEYSNGGFCLSIVPETSIDKGLMLETIRECVLRSKETETCLTIPSRITSIRHPGFDQFKGVYLSLEVYQSILFGGDIYNAIKDEFGISLRTVKPKGRQLGRLPAQCDIRLAEIAW
jgi:hypothetical protein